MSYNKPMVVAQNSAAGSFAAGCPAKDTWDSTWTGCKACERTR